MDHDVVLLPSARRELRSLSEPTLTRVLHALDRLRTDPRPPRSLRLAGSSGGWRIRVGSWRILYAIDDRLRVVTVVRIGHRRDVYR